MNSIESVDISTKLLPSEQFQTTPTTEIIESKQDTPVKKIIKVNNPQKAGFIFHYAHFICDCLFPEIISEIYNYDETFRIKIPNQVVGSFKHIYEEVMNIKLTELAVEEYDKIEQKQIILPLKETLRNISSMTKFRNYIFDRYSISPDKYIVDYPEVLLIKRGLSPNLMTDIEVRKKVKPCILKTGIERREINQIGKVETYLTKKYKDKFRAVSLEEIPFKEQVLLFNNAKLIILAHGAGMSNMFFCKKQTKIIEVVCGKKWAFFDILSQTLSLQHEKLQNNSSIEIIRYLSGVTTTLINIREVENKSTPQPFKKCARTTCNMIANLPKNNRKGYCCRSCINTSGRHGRACTQKNINPIMTYSTTEMINTTTE